MVATSHWDHRVQQSRFPPTPPEYSGYYTSSTGTAYDDTDAYYRPARTHSVKHGHSSRHSASRYDTQAAAAYPTHQPQSRSKHAKNSGYLMSYGQNLGSNYGYAPIMGPMLPPIQTSDPMHYEYSEPKHKEEKPTGGVAQVLDYEMEHMTDFVAENCQMIISRTSRQPTAQFRKYVLQILSSTRLPSSTILLGLFYLQERVKKEGVPHSDPHSSGILMRMLTVGLLLGSKFLDDNTFQNRSWAEVSSIPVHELNQMELQWLIGFDWEIHQILKEDQGLDMWIEHWHSYQQKRMDETVRKAHKLAPIHTNINRMSIAQQQHHQHQQPLMSPEGPIPPEYQHSAQYESMMWNQPRYSEYSPPSGPFSGPTTPDNYNTWHYSSLPEACSQASWQAPTKSTYSQRAQIASYDLPYYAPTYAWSSPHPAHCSCSLCLHPTEYRLDAAGYPVQTVYG